ncbi:MAG: hypothetical protein AAGM38_04765 [Pseudomonadota bacterium]
MKRTRSLRPARLSSIARARPRTRSAAATALVRIEYERERLLRDLATLDQRRVEAVQRLRLIQEHAERLQKILAEDPMDETGAAPAVCASAASPRIAEPR